MVINAQRHVGIIPKEIKFAVVGRTMQERIGMRGEGIRNVFSEELTNEMNFKDMMGNTLILDIAVDIDKEVDKVLEKKLAVDIS